MVWGFDPRRFFAVSSPMSYWADKVAVITGGSGGLGRSIAHALARRGLKIVLAARNSEQLESATATIRSAGGTALPIVADITCQDDVERLFHRVIEEFGRLDVLVNSAGRSARGQILDTTPEEFKALMELNFIAAVRRASVPRPELLKNHGHLINIGSLSGKSASRYVGAYPASKFALSAYTQQLRLELSPQGLHVLLVSPGPIARENAEQRYSDQVAGLPERAKKPGAGVKLRAVSPDKLSEAIVRACEAAAGRSWFIRPTCGFWSRSDSFRRGLAIGSYAV